MSGPSSLSSKKSLLTRYCNNLKRLLDRGDSKSETSEDGSFRTFLDLDKAQCFLYELESTSNLVLATLDSFLETVDSLSNSLNEEQERQATAYIETAHDVLDRASSLAIKFDAHLKQTRDRTATANQNISRDAPHGQIGGGPFEGTLPKLPAIPIPAFSGNVWEFENFWTLFTTNVHERPLTKLQKFNYLLNALKGEAREMVLRFPITENGYDDALERLRSRYGDESKLVAMLHARLEETKLERQGIQEQRRLLEQIVATVTQLERKGINLDGSYMTRKVLSKFDSSTQHFVLERCLARGSQECAWKMKDVLMDLDHHITTKERINEMMTQPDIQQKKTKDLSRMITRTASCIFCQSQDHKSASCLKYPTISLRRICMQEHQRCLNCGRQGHFVKACPHEGCRSCQGKKHHHALCPRVASDAKSDTQRKEVHVSSKCTDAPAIGKREAISFKVRPKQGKPMVTRTHQVQSGARAPEEEQVPQVNEDALVLHHADDSAGDAKGRVSLLTGCARVKDLRRRQWKEVEILFDTGADQSFVSAALAQDLGLECSSPRRLTLVTFGSETPKTVECGTTTLELWDRQGVSHPVQLFITTTLTRADSPTHLTSADVNFIASHGIALSKASRERRSTPQILLGCDQLWNFLESTNPRYRLPSGLQAIPSKFGYLLSGKQNASREASDAAEHQDALRMNTFATIDDELTRWDRYWTLDSAGICEFAGTKDAEKKAVNAKVMEFFNSTIEKRPDGYYVRLPYKKAHAPLPTNKAIALKRLQSVLATLRLRPTILEEYDKTIRTQLQQGIIETVSGTEPEEGTVVHYIPHQPVITPQKETTKLRIVFDASSHYKKCPSLNEVLFQGPLILPELYAVLLRFRIPPYVVVSDVEKAFLQVRLHEVDRDATRFLWVKDVDQPVEPNNIVTYRFTRVTFGLNVSPFLLGRTIRYHLRTSVDNEVLAGEIRDNLYVDNLVLAAQTPEEAEHKSLSSRAIFAGMGMNLREFLSNDTSLPSKLPMDARAKSTTQKVLGVKWDAIRDTLSIECQLPPSEVITKRVVARRIASVYDPFGWLVPLLTRVKSFQQELWKQGLTWDEELPSSLREKWTILTQDAHGFQKSFPRRVLSDSGHCDLAVFADASDIAIACCAYLFNGTSSSLVMAKCKLPSIRTKTTMPKLEMNALTMACRLAQSIFTAIRHQLNGRLRRIFMFSDSQIVLSWLGAPPHQANLGRLVDNRLREVRRIVDALNEEGVTVQFRYVSTTENTADTGTRGLTKEQLLNHSWWTGPPLLRQPIEQWAPPYNLRKEEGDASKADSAVNAVQVQIQDTKAFLEWSRFSTLHAALRVTVIGLIFVKKILRCVSPDRRERIFSTIPIHRIVPDAVSQIGGPAISAARELLVRDHLSIWLTKAYRKSMENSLRLYKDQQHIWRCKGRLGNSILEDDAKNPIFIAPNTFLANLIVRQAHGDYHQGVDHTMATVRSQYWIPKLRLQVRRLVQGCISCRRFNALPYSYPNSTDLPHRRVVRARPFENIGLDFFDLPAIKKDVESTKTYGCIFTCTVTRLVHLELVPSMNTTDFINALRRFIARRGVPRTITCDNAPTFLLAAKVLSDQTPTIRDDIRYAVAEREIEWKHITPYAPWQGGLYERLIKSVKHALYKAWRVNYRRTEDELRTVLTEIEGCLNTRPLTYQGSTHEELSSIRPIDFLQKDIDITLPLSHLTAPHADELEYHPPEVLRALSTQQEVRDALRSSCVATEKFWTVWQQQYLTGLRETHKATLGGKRLGQEEPVVGDIVLVNDPVLPRNDWKIARITDTTTGADGKVREAELVTATRKKIRRPINLLIPLEVQSSRQCRSDPQGAATFGPTSTTPHSYNLRPRPSEQTTRTMITHIRSTSHSASRRWFLFYLMLLTLTRMSLTLETADMHMECTKKGVLVTTSAQKHTFEICADNHCQLHEVTRNGYLVKFSPEHTLHDHSVLLKWKTATKVAVILLRRLIASGRLILFRRVAQRSRPTRPERTAAALVVLACLTLILAPRADTYQQTDVLRLQSTECIEDNGREKCTVILSEVLKLNTFKREACQHLTRNNTILTNVRLRWKGLYLRCELYYTRSTELRVQDSKRCPHMGSCSGNKCTDVKDASLIPELEDANHFPGHTGCMESCDGPGCDCFYLRSGCLFYRVNAVSRNPTVHETFRRVALVVSYLCLEAFGKRLIWCIIRALAAVICCPLRFVKYALTQVLRRNARRPHEKSI